MAYFPPTGSVVAFQSQPSSLLVGASIIGLTPVAPVPASVFVINPVSTITVTPPANQSVSGTVHIDNLSSVVAYQLAGSILAVSGSFSAGNTSVTLQPSSNVIGSVATLQGTNPWITQVVGSVLTIQTTSTNVSVITVGGSTGNSSVQLLNGENVIGSVAALQGTNPWKVNVPTPSYVTYQLAGSILAVSASGGNSSVVVNNIVTGQSSVYLIPGVGVLGSVAALQGTSPWLVQLTTGSVITTGGNSSVQVNNILTGNSSVQLISTSASIAVLVNNQLQGITSVLLMSQSASIATQVNRILTGVSSVQLMAGTNNAGSITAIQGTNPWVVGNSSVMTIQGTTPWVVGSVIATIQGSVAAVPFGTNISSISGVGGRAITSSIYAVLSSITTVSILSTNLNRIGATVFNASGTDVFVKLGVAVTTSVYTVKMTNGSYYELPFGWGGVVAGITASNAGIINVTELT